MDQGDRVKPNQPDEAGARPERAPYQKPEIAWEEPFQQVVALSCALVGSFGDCAARPAT